MFEAFLNFAGCPGGKPVKNEKEFLQLYSGKTFLNGMYRLFKEEDRPKWTAIVEAAFPAYRGTFFIFGFDWLGRVFAVEKATGTILLFEPGTGEVLEAPMTFEEFHDETIALSPEDCIASEAFEEWRQQNNNYELSYNECAGYRVPLFLNGDDEIKNMEASDMEVYWDIMTPLFQM